MKKTISFLAIASLFFLGSCKENNETPQEAATASENSVDLSVGQEGVQDDIF